MSLDYIKYLSSQLEGDLVLLNVCLVNLLENSFFVVSKAQVHSSSGRFAQILLCSCSCLVIHKGREVLGSATLRLIDAGFDLKILWVETLLGFFLLIHIIVPATSVLVFQREYYATHQCFLTPRSLFLAVWKVPSGEEGLKDLDDWLRNIQVHACIFCFLLEQMHLGPSDFQTGPFIEIGEGFL